MRNKTITTRLPHDLLRGLLVLLLLLLVQLAPLHYSMAFADTPAVDSSENITSLIAGLSDEQVRSLLIDELTRQSAPATPPAHQDITGLGTFFSWLLQSLSNQSSESGRQVQALFQDVPLVWPDLYTVFIAL